MKLHDFNESISVGDYGESVIKEYLESLETVQNIKDVSGNKKYQDKDIDLLINFKDGTNCTAEIKTDTYTSGNIFFETVSNLEFGTTGCMYKTEANCLLYYFTKTRELYLINMKKYRDWFLTNKHLFTEKKLKNVNKKRNGTYTSVGYTIPKIFLEKHFKYYKKVIL